MMGSVSNDDLDEQVTFSFPIFNVYSLGVDSTSCLFEFNQPYLHDPNLTNEQNKLIQPNGIRIYRTKNIIKSDKDIINNSNLYREIRFKDDGYTFIANLEINQEYYYIAQATTLYSGKYPIQSKIIKLNLTRNDKYNILQKEIVEQEDFVEKMKLVKFSEKIFIKPNFNNFSSGNITKPFSLGNTEFNSADIKETYIKVRITSKKTNRKIDLNLKYTFDNKIEKITEQNLKTKNSEKLE